MKTQKELEKHLNKVGFSFTDTVAGIVEYQNRELNSLLICVNDGESSEGSVLRIRIPLTLEEIQDLPEDFQDLVKMFKVELLKKGRQQHKLHEAHEILSPYVEKLEELKVVIYVFDNLVGKGMIDFRICVAVNAHQFIKNTPQSEEVAKGKSVENGDEEEEIWFTFYLNTETHSLCYSFSGEDDQERDQIFKDWALRHGIYPDSSGHMTWGDISRIGELFEIITELNNLYLAQIPQA